MTDRTGIAKAAIVTAITGAIIIDMTAMAGPLTILGPVIMTGSAWVIFAGWKESGVTGANDQTGTSSCPNAEAADGKFCLLLNAEQRLGQINQRRGEGNGQGAGSWK
jgi:hypothetical protein